MFGFAVCWLPYHIYFLYTYDDKDIVRMAMYYQTYIYQRYLRHDMFRESRCDKVTNKQ